MPKTATPLVAHSHQALCWDFATTGAVKNAPDKEIIGELFKTMFGGGGHEKKITGLESIPLTVVKQNADLTWM